MGSSTALYEVTSILHTLYAWYRWEVVKVETHDQSDDQRMGLVSFGLWLHQGFLSALHKRSRVGWEVVCQWSWHFAGQFELGPPEFHHYNNDTINFSSLSSCSLCFSLVICLDCSFLDTGTLLLETINKHWPREISMVGEVRQSCGQCCVCWTSALSWWRRHDIDEAALIVSHCWMT